MIEPVHQQIEQIFHESSRQVFASLARALRDLDLAEDAMQEAFVSATDQWARDGYWLWEVTSMDEAVEWVRRCPNPMNEESDIEIRQFYEMDDFSENDPEGKVAAHEDELRTSVVMQDSTLTKTFWSPLYGMVTDKFGVGWMVMVPGEPH